VLDIGKVEILPGKVKVEVMFLADGGWRYACNAPSEYYIRTLKQGDRVSVRPDDQFAHLKTQGKHLRLKSKPRIVGKPLEGWLWPAPTAGGHIDHSSLKKQHAKTFRTVNAEAERNNVPPLTPFVLYAFRHTFLTRLGQ
jgi:hypothetical protein